MPRFSGGSFLGDSVKATQKGMDAYEEYKDKFLKKYDPLTSKYKVQHWFIFLEALSLLEDEGKSEILVRDVWRRMYDTGYRYVTASGRTPDKEQSLTAVAGGLLQMKYIELTDLDPRDDEDYEDDDTDPFYEFFEDTYGRGTWEAEIERLRAEGRF